MRLLDSTAQKQSESHTRQICDQAFFSFSVNGESSPIKKNAWSQAYTSAGFAWSHIYAFEKVFELHIQLHS